MHHANLKQCPFKWLWCAQLSVRYLVQPANLVCHQPRHKTSTCLQQCGGQTGTAHTMTPSPCHLGPRMFLLPTALYKAVLPLPVPLSPSWEQQGSSTSAEQRRMFTGFCLNSIILISPKNSVSSMFYIVSTAGTSVLFLSVHSHLQNPLFRRQVQGCGSTLGRQEELVYSGVNSE